MNLKKALPSIIILFLLSTMSYAQTKQFSLMNVKDRNIITSMEYISHFSVAAIGGNIPANIDKNMARIDDLQWKTAVTPSANGFKLAKQLQKIKTVFPGPTGKMIYNSENTFESTEGSEILVKNPLAILKKPFSYTFSTNGQSADSLNKGEKIWLTNLPVLDSKMQMLSGLFFTAKIPENLKKGDSWTDSIKTEDYIVANYYTVNNIQGSDLLLTLSNKQINLKNNVSQAVLSGSVNVPTGVSLGITKKAKSYSGQIKVNSQTRLISSMDLSVETESVNTMNSNNTPSKGNASLKVENHIL